MQLQMTLQVRMYVECRLCKSSLEHPRHVNECPLGIINRIAENAERTAKRCRHCNGPVYLNTDDYFECEDCRTQYTTRLGSDQPGDVLFLYGNDDEITPVLLMSKKGRRQFQHKRAIQNARKRISLWRALNRERVLLNQMLNVDRDLGGYHRDDGVYVCPTKAVEGAFD